VFTARYGLMPYIKQILRSVLKRLTWELKPSYKVHAVARSFLKISLLPRSCFDVLNTFSSKVKRSTQNCKWYVPKFYTLNRNCIVLCRSVSTPSTDNFMHRDRRTTGKINWHNKGKWCSEKVGEVGSNTASKLTRCNLTKHDDRNRKHRNYSFLNY
jgi:hypothetical protein